MNASNSSTVPPSPSSTSFTTETIVTAVFMIIVAILATGGNFLVIAAVLWNRRLRTPTNFLFLNLAVADFFQGSIAIPLRLAEVLNYTDKQPLIPCLVVIPLTIFFFGASNFNVTLISVDRFVALHWSFLYPILATPIHLFLIVISLWCFMLLFALLPIMGWGRAENVELVNICLYSTTLTKEYLFTMFSFVNFGVIITLAITNFYILRTAQRQIRQIHVLGQSTDTYANTEASQSRLDNMHSEAPPEESAVVNQNSEVKDKVIGLSVAAVRQEAGTCCDVSNANGEIQENARYNSKENNGCGTRSKNNHSIITGRTNKALSVTIIDERPAESCRSASDAAILNPHVKRKTKKQNLYRERRATKTVLIIVGIFILFTTPITMIDIVSLSGCPTCSPPTLTKIFVCLAYANACVNVFVYAGYKKDMKDTWIAMYKSLRNTICRRD